jgi:hypothetical protein
MSEELQTRLVIVTAEVDKADAVLARERAKKDTLAGNLEKQKAVIRELVAVRDPLRAEQMAIHRVLGGPGQTIGGE